MSEDTGRGRDGGELSKGFGKRLTVAEPVERAKTGTINERLKQAIDKQLEVRRVEDLLRQQTGASDAHVFEPMLVCDVLFPSSS
jgi:hypothetical protein